MLNLKLSPQAILDLEDIFEFTYSNWNLKQAEKYQDDFYEHFMMIIQNPEVGGKYEYKPGGYRKLNCNKHLIFYKIVESSCVIVRILHEQVDLTLKLDD